MAEHTVIRGPQGMPVAVELVPVAELARLRRIEAAARKVSATWDGDFCLNQEDFADALLALDRALRGEEEKRG